VAIVAGLAFVTAQQIGFLFLPDGPARTLSSDAANILATAFATACCIAAALRARGISRIFWLLFGATFALQFAANSCWAGVHYFHLEVQPNSVFPSIFYRLYAGPIAIALFLSQEVRHSRLESFLHACIVVGLVSLTMYQIQIMELSSHDVHLWRVISIGTAVNFILILAAVSRYACSSIAEMKDLFARLSVYVLVYAGIALLSSVGDAFLQNIDRYIDLLWPVTYLTGAIVAVTWNPSAAIETRLKSPINRRTSLLIYNVILAAMVFGSAILGLSFYHSARTVGMTAVGFVLLSYAVRCALMQDNMEKYLAELQENRKQLQRQALYDMLTGLPNRRLFAEQISKTLSLAKRHHHVVALLYIDLDGFKLINDVQGHATGDLVLQRAAKQMMSRARESDTVARIGGDEFTLVASQLPGAEQAESLAQDLLRALAEPFEIDGFSFAVTASIGISLFPLTAGNPKELLHQADLAMYAVKRKGKNGIGIYNGELQPGIGKPESLAPDLHEVAGH
jgi:diguanylate cyclase (GGDEF)-like protein